MNRLESLLFLPIRQPGVSLDFVRKNLHSIGRVQIRPGSSSLQVSPHPSNEVRPTGFIGQFSLGQIMLKRGQIEGKHGTEIPFPNFSGCSYNLRL